MNNHDMERRYDGPMPTRRDPAQVQRSVIADLQRLRDRTALALSNIETTWGVDDVRHLRESLNWYNAQLARIEDELTRRR